MSTYSWTTERSLFSETMSLGLHNCAFGTNLLVYTICMYVCIQYNVGWQLFHKAIWLNSRCTLYNSGKRGRKRRRFSENACVDLFLGTLFRANIRGSLAAEEVWLQSLTTNLPSLMVECGVLWVFFFPTDALFRKPPHNVPPSLRANHLRSASSGWPNFFINHHMQCYR